MNPLAIILFIFAGALFLYALILGVTGNYNLVARSWAAKPKDRKAYARAVARIIAFVAIAVVAAGITAIFLENAVPAIVLIGGVILAIVIGVQIMQKGDAQ